MKKLSLLGLLCTAFSVLSFAGVPPVKSSQTFDYHISKAESYFSQSKDAPYHLTERISSDNFEAMTFYYDDANRLICIYDSSDLQVRDSLTYNQNNQVIRLDGYQWMNEDWTHVYYIEYTYDANGNRNSRTNYNYIQGEGFVLGGIYEYNYEQNVLVSHTMYFGENWLYETCDYIYNAAEQLIMELYMQDGFSGFDSSMKVLYFYNDDGRLSRKENYFYDESGWNMESYDEYVYDASGNCTEHNKKNPSGDYVDRRLYEFNAEISASDVILPTASPELYLPEFFDDANMRVLEHWYAADFYNPLQYICDYVYYYDGESVGIRDVAARTEMTAYPNPTNGIVHLSDANTQSSVACVSVWDVQGRPVGNVSLGQDAHTVDLSGCRSGIYLLRAECKDGGVHFVKVVKK